MLSNTTARFFDGYEVPAGDRRRCRCAHAAHENRDVEKAEFPSYWIPNASICDRVACAVGRLSVRVFGIRGQDGAALAFHLGRALQLTNILRDLDEDAAKARLYLPREALLAAGIGQTDPATNGARERCATSPVPRDRVHATMLALGGTSVNRGPSGRVEQSAVTP